MSFPLGCISLQEMLDSTAFKGYMAFPDIRRRQNAVNSFLTMYSVVLLVIECLTKPWSRNATGVLWDEIILAELNCCAPTFENSCKTLKTRHRNGVSLRWLLMYVSRSPPCSSDCPFCCQAEISGQRVIRKALWVLLRQGLDIAVRKATILQVGQQHVRAFVQGRPRKPPQLLYDGFQYDRR